MKPTNCIVKKLCKATNEETANCIAMAIDYIGNDKIKSGEEYAFLLNVINSQCNYDGFYELYNEFKRDRKKPEYSTETRIKNALKSFTTYAQKRGLSDEEIEKTLKTIIKGE